MIAEGWTTLIVVDPAPNSNIHTGHPDEAIRSVILDRVEPFTFEGRQVAQGYIHSGKDQHGVRWTVDHSSLDKLTDQWVSADGSSAKTLGRLEPGESLESITRGREQYLERINAGSKLQTSRNSTMEIMGAKARRKELKEAPQGIARIDDEIAALVRRREELLALEALHRWYFGFSEVQPA